MLVLAPESSFVPNPTGSRTPASPEAAPRGQPSFRTPLLGGERELTMPLMLMLQLLVREVLRMQKDVDERRRHKGLMPLSVCLSITYGTKGVSLSHNLLSSCWNCCVCCRCSLLSTALGVSEGWGDDFESFIGCHQFVAMSQSRWMTPKATEMINKFMSLWT